MSRNIVHKHSPEHYPDRSTFHGNPICLVRWGFSRSRESVWLSSLPLLHLPPPPQMSSSSFSSPFGDQPCEHWVFLSFDQVYVMQRHRIVMRLEVVQSLAWLFFSYILMPSILIVPALVSGYSQRREFLFPMLCQCSRASPLQQG